MDQVKIGKFIAQCRKEQNLTQAQLAEKLNVTDKAISKWETGKGLPDSSIMLELCKKLNINANELLSGERLNTENYQEKADENIVYITKEAEKNKKIKNKIIIIFSIFMLGLIIGITAISIYNNVEIDIAYDERIIKCEIVDNDIICSCDGLSFVQFYHTEVNTDGETYMFIKGKMLLQNKVRSHFETWDTMAELNSGEASHFSSKIIIDINKDVLDCKDKIKIYYTNIPFEKIQKANEDELLDIIKNSHLICEN
ncbi:MAG: helix-turn-helix transcriptional regulator [Clostridia bacterium]|nr:helix-turn-helix transcriptional regulator [Clostridia bacterium]